MFVYGSLKSDELAWPLISNFVRESVPGRLGGYVLLVSDGIAHAAKRPNYSIHGELLNFKNHTDAYRVISQFEGTLSNSPRYKWVVVDFDGVRANMLEIAGPHPTAKEAHSWSISDDEVFAKGIPWLHEAISTCQARLEPFLKPSNKSDVYWDTFFQLQASLLFLWGVQERLELFRLGATDEPTRSINSRRAEWLNDQVFQDAVKAANIDKSLKVNPWRNPAGNPRRADTNPLSVWAEVRHNISHHAKGSEKEVSKVLTAAIDHFNTLFIYLSKVSPRLAENWNSLTKIKTEV
jgi:hypothetical protein